MTKPEPLLRAQHYRYRSAITGRFVTEAFAEANPHITVRQPITRKTLCTG